MKTNRPSYKSFPRKLIYFFPSFVAIGKYPYPRALSHLSPQLYRPPLSREPMSTASGSVGGGCKIKFKHVPSVTCVYQQLQIYRFSRAQILRNVKTVCCIIIQDASTFSAISAHQPASSTSVCVTMDTARYLFRFYKTIIYSLNKLQITVLTIMLFIIKLFKIICYILCIAFVISVLHTYIKKIPIYIIYN